jgi:hypothetical protein
MSFLKFHSIGSVRDMLNYNKKYKKYNDILEFTGSVKLHGTHGDLVLTKTDNEIELCVQSRNRILTIDSDNYGFAKFINNIPKDKFINFEFDHQVIISGEFCGGNIQSKVALTQLPIMFVIYSIKIDGKFINTKDININLPEHNVYSITRAPLYHCKIRLDEFYSENLEDLEYIVNITDIVEKECPFSKTFNVYGIGEGIVWIYDNDIQDTSMWFKSKGDMHKVSKVDKVTFSQDKLENMNLFVKNTVLPTRLQQGIEYLKEMNLDISKSNLSVFLKWMVQDILKEENDTIVNENFNVKLLQKYISNESRCWFFNNL